MKGIVTMLDKTYNPSDIEEKHYKKWEEQGAFSCEVNEEKKPYCVMIPPPNVTGNLHMGHALTFSLQDILIRYKRMTGLDVLWQPGTDHAGIATQMVVERNLAKEGISRHDLGREKFVEKVWEWKKQSGGQITTQLRRLGASLDWPRERFTMDEGLSKAVRKVFVSLYKEGLIYKDKRLVNWDPKLHTAISDLEVEQKETVGTMWYFKYPIEGEENRFITIGTTRPETMLGDTGVAVSDEDDRYKDLIGKNCILPIANRSIPIVADEHADPEKGTGAVKITPAHDFNDFEVGKRCGLEMVNILDADANLNENTPERYQGLSTKEARKKIIKELKDLGLYVKEEDNEMVIPYGDRSGVIIEPWLTDQWFVDAKYLAKEAIKAVETGKMKFVPKMWENTYFEWMRNIQPWCISRQLWWGHQVPVWYAEDGTIFCEETKEQALEKAKEKYGKDVELTRDEDVLDTWFSSALWPFSTLGWPEETKELKHYYPTNVLVTGFDIIFFWVARMMMMGLHFMKEVPFDTVYIHALVRDENGQKMSKSKGNVVDPLELINKYGADALRFTMSAMAAQGRDVIMSEKRVEGYRNFATKLWNASRFCQMNECSYDDGFEAKKVEHSLNKWLITKTSKACDEITQNIETYRFNEAANSVYSFVWGTFCDWYLELAKPIFNGQDEKLKKETKQTCAWVLDRILIMLHPFMPYVTEELWGKIGQKRENMLIKEAWPTYLKEMRFEDGEQRVDWLVDFISTIRSLRAEMNVPAGKKVPVMVKGASEFSKACICDFEKIISFMARLDDLQINENADKDKGSAQEVFKETTIFMPLAGIIDISEEKARLEKELSKIEKDLVVYDKKLSNPNFVNKAPEKVVEEQKRRQTEAKKAKEKIGQGLERLAKL